MSAQRDAQMQAAIKANVEGRLGDAESISRTILASSPNDAEAMIVLGIVLFKKRDILAAHNTLERALELAPESLDAPFWLSMVLKDLGRIAEAHEMARMAVQRNERNEHALNMLGMCALDRGFGEEAIFAFRRATELAPNSARYFEGLGRALQVAGRTREAIVAFQRVLEIGPVRPASLFRLGDAYMVEANPLEAERCARAILRMEPNSAQGALLLARALIGDGRVAEGAEFAKHAIEFAPENAVPVAYYGRALQSLGRISEAETQFRRSIELEPRQGFAYYALTQNGKIRDTDRPLVDTMRKLDEEGGLPLREQIQLKYGLGKAMDDLGDYESAMRHFDSANRLDHNLKAGVSPFEPEALRKTADFLIDTFNTSFLERYRLEGSPSELPLFVVGMMRSGTTLAEQILSSHSQVGGAGEQLFWPDNAGSGQKVFVLRSSGPELDLSRLTQLTVEYLNLLQKVAPGTKWVVDKMNTNYLLLGLLHVAFPNARIVHMVRHPVDTCISIWATPVAKDIDLCGEKENLVFAYRQYLRIMDHWRSVIPKDRLLDVRYEELVADRERLTREMTDFCGLPWEDAFLSPENNDRSVKTPSVWQVRQPVYKSSVERWRKYHPWLGAFADLLDHNQNIIN